MNGIIIINKPSGISSSSVVGKIKKIFNSKKVGHLGTLDPLASGVLPVCVGKATKLFDFYLKKSKTYIAQFTFGKSTDTLDSEGKVVDTTENIPSVTDIKNALPKLTNQIEQMPPKFSAKNVNGSRAYDLARKGIDFDLQPKSVVINKFSLIRQISDATFEFLIDCSSGTYIRSLARDLGKLCNSCAYMNSLIRTRAGEFKLENAVELDNVSEKDLISLDVILKSLEKINVSDIYFEKLKNGNSINLNVDSKENFLIYCKNKLFGIADCIEGKTKVKINLFDED